MTDFQVAEMNDENISSLEVVNKEALLEGYDHIEKTLAEWRSGENRFSKSGEKLWGIFIGPECIAVGGINIDPYLENNDGTVGRVRQVYVMKEYRGQGLSKVL